MYFDNLFTSFSLLKRSKTLGFEGTGTMKEDRIGRNCPILDSKSYKKKQSGCIASSKNVDDESILVRWKDSNVAWCSASTPAR